MSRHNSTIKAPTGSCVDCGSKYVYAAGRCQRDFWKHRHEVRSTIKPPAGSDTPLSTRKQYPTKGEPKREARKRIKSVSAKQQKRLIAYMTLRIVWLEQHPNCQRCGGEATDVHHAAGREGDLLLDTTKFRAMCRECHNWVELHPIEAKELGYSLSRLNNDAA